MSKKHFLKKERPIKTQQSKALGFRNKFKILFTHIKGPKLFGRFLLKLSLFLFGPFISVSNPEKIPLVKGDNIVFAFNHNNALETVSVASTLIFLRGGKLISFIIAWMFGKIPMLGIVFNQINPVYVYSKPSRFGWLNRINEGIPGWQSVIDRCKERLSLGMSLGIFPEGVRNRNPKRLRRGKNGIGRLVLQTGIKVLPIGIDYVRRRRQGVIPSLGRMNFIIGDIMDFSKEVKTYEKVRKSDSDFEGKSASMITYQVMMALSKLCGKSYPYDPPKMD
ncbi:MAG: 1-acyl-sn-glycerol-3-phosphate acyltransferase [Spirochaetales bacterium]|nr:1-acyl-sn-glycerol-3-phosphate acyltransferase [Spirochaetales bacterium]